jgi:mercuric reductase
MAMATIFVPTETLREPATARTNLLQALVHLQQVLPLEKRQQSLSPPLRMVHRAILRSLGETGKALRQAEVAAMLGSRQSGIHALGVLGSNDLVILNAPVTRDEKTKQLIVSETVELVGAYPMTTENTPHHVVMSGHSIHAMCALDALAISPMFGHETWIESRCHVTGTVIRIFQRRREILEANPSHDIRVGIHWKSFHSCAAHTLCTEMVFLKDSETAENWRSRDPNSIDVFTLAEAIELGAAFFLPLLED